MLSLIRFLRKVYPISEQLGDILEDTIKSRTVKRREKLLRAGHICRHIYIVESGTLRSFYVKEDRDISTSFALEYGFCTVPSSFFSQTPSEGVSKRWSRPLF